MYNIDEVTNNTTLVTDSVTKGTRGFNLNELPSLNRYNCTYDVQVQMDNGSGFGAYAVIFVILPRWQLRQN